MSIENNQDAIKTAIEDETMTCPTDKMFTDISSLVDDIVLHLNILSSFYKDEKDTLARIEKDVRFKFRDSLVKLKEGVAGNFTKDTAIDIFKTEMIANCKSLLDELLKKKLDVKTLTKEQLVEPINGLKESLNKNINTEGNNIRLEYYLNKETGRNLLESRLNRILSKPIALSNSTEFSPLLLLRSINSLLDKLSITLKEHDTIIREILLQYKNNVNVVNTTREYYKYVKINVSKNDEVSNNLFSNYVVYDIDSAITMLMSSVDIEQLKQIESTDKNNELTTEFIKVNSLLPQVLETANNTILKYYDKVLSELELELKDTKDIEDYVSDIKSSLDKLKKDLDISDFDKNIEYNAIAIKDKLTVDKKYLISSLNISTAVKTILYFLIYVNTLVNNAIIELRVPEIQPTGDE